MMYKSKALLYANFIKINIRYILDFYTEPCYTDATIKRTNQSYERRTIMNFFLFIKDHVISVHELLGLSVSASRVSDYDVMRVLR